MVLLLAQGLGQAGQQLVLKEVCGLVEDLVLGKLVVFQSVLYLRVAQVVQVGQLAEALIDIYGGLELAGRQNLIVRWLVQNLHALLLWICH